MHTKDLVSLHYAMMMRHVIERFTGYDVCLRVAYDLTKAVDELKQSLRNFVTSLDDPDLSEWDEDFDDISDEMREEIHHEADVTLQAELATEQCLRATPPEDAWKIVQDLCSR